MSQARDKEVQYSTDLYNATRKEKRKQEEEIVQLKDVSAAMLSLTLNTLSQKHTFLISFRSERSSWWHSSTRMQICTSYQRQFPRIDFHKLNLWQFSEEYLKQGMAGGKKAAHAFMSKVRDYLSSIPHLVKDPKSIQSSKHMPTWKAWKRSVWQEMKWTDRVISEDSAQGSRVPS